MSSPSPGDRGLCADTGPAGDEGAVGPGAADPGGADRGVASSRMWADQPIWAIGGAVPSPATAARQGFDDSRPPMSSRDWLLEVLTAIGVAVGVAGLGAPFAWVWAKISPNVVLQMTPNGPAHIEPNPEGYAGAESIYLLITFGLGLVSAVAAWLLARRRRGPILLAGLAVGSVAGAASMAWIGHKIGLAEYQRLLTQAPVGARFEVPVSVRSSVLDPPLVQGAVLVQAIAAVTTYTLLAGFSVTANLRPQRRAARSRKRQISSGWPAQQDHPRAPAPPVAD